MPSFPLLHRLLLAAFIGGLTLTCPAFAAEKRPNIIMIVADDMGYSDIGCFGSEIATPNLDKLAARGVRFSQFYTTPKCFPSRASFLTGLYPHQVGMGRSPGHLRGAPTVAQTLRSAGYATWMSGKWHGRDLPVQLGFEHSFGLVDGQVNHFNPGRQRPGEPAPSQDKGERRWAFDGQEFRPWTPDDPKFYSTDAYTDRALQFIQDQKDDRPFFLHLAYTAPHYPIQAWPEDIAKYRGKYLAGWDVIRTARYERQRAQGLLTPGMQQLPPRGSIKYADVRKLGPWLPRFWDDSQLIMPWNEVPDQDRWDLKMAVYAAMVDRLDQNIGRLVAKLESLGKLENTLIVFFSDNGASGGTHHYGTTTKDEPTSGPGPMDSFHTYDTPWAAVSNTPFRGYKDTCYEGGYATPFIACWPAGLKARPGSVRHDVGHIIDLAPTFFELAGATRPELWEGKPTPALEGRSLLSVFSNTGNLGERTLYWEYNEDASIRSGDWKLTRYGKDPWELYDLSKDRGEQNNLTGSRPEIARELEARWTAWAQRLGIDRLPPKKPISE
ncbi:MAG: arylsulfatase [Opitutaceae bacterium]|nr:arylsulfatase [Opitutaceae bacterium]